jgi:hypothetical protein
LLEPHATRLWNRSRVQQPIPISGGFFYTPERASELAGLSNQTLFNWAKAHVTSYGYPLNVIEHQNHRLIDERDVHAIAAVQKDFPLGGGPIPTNKREQMKRYAAQVRAKLTR